MKTYAFLAAVLAVTCACSSSTSDRPSVNDERQAAIDESDRAETRAAMEESPERDALDPQERRADDPPGYASAQQRETVPRANDATESDNNDEADITEHAPDNTGRNERDDAPGKLTALDQSNSESDVDITAAIRKKVVGDDALSFNAKNVKIITVSGKVTLRGPVASAAESTAIEKSARAVTGVVQVDNQIEVKR